MEKAMAPHSSTLAWKIPWTEEPGRLQSMGSLRVGHDWATSLSLLTFIHWRRKWQPTPVFLPGESQGQGEPGGLPSMGSHRVRHDWSDLAAAACSCNDIEHLFIYMLTVYNLWKNVSLGHLPIFNQIFLYWVVWFPYIFWKLIPYYIYSLQRFSPVP